MHHRSFLGMTVHWIDGRELKKHYAVLCCKELSVAHTFDVLANTIQDVHRSFGINRKLRAL